MRKTTCRPRLLAALGVVLSITLAAACAHTSDARSGTAPGRAEEPSIEVGIDNLNAVLWVQTSVEYRANSLQAYALAGRLLDDALADPRWTAALEQTGGDYRDLPPAIILDVDETVLDNSYYEARLTLDREVYAPQSWDDWVLEEAATAVPGAREFLAGAAARGVTVFYVTNRRAHLEEATRANLAALGFPLEEEVDTLLLRGEIPEWESADKTPRRAHVAARYRVLLQFGDNMGDFTAASEGTVAERAAFAEEHREYWGTRWITLANPTYGSFIGAVLDDDYGQPLARQVALKKEALDPRRR